MQLNQTSSPRTLLMIEGTSGTFVYYLRCSFDNGQGDFSFFIYFFSSSFLFPCLSITSHLKYARLKMGINSHVGEACLSSYSVLNFLSISCTQHTVYCIGFDRHFLSHLDHSSCITSMNYYRGNFHGILKKHRTFLFNQLRLAGQSVSSDPSAYLAPDSWSDGRDNQRRPAKMARRYMWNTHFFVRSWHTTSHTVHLGRKSPK